MESDSAARLHGKGWGRGVFPPQPSYLTTPDRSTAQLQKVGATSASRHDLSSVAAWSSNSRPPPSRAAPGPRIFYSTSRNQTAHRAPCRIPWPSSTVHYTARLATQGAGASQRPRMAGCSSWRPQRRRAARGPRLPFPLSRTARLIFDTMMP